MRRAKDHFPNDKATHEWLGSQKRSTRATYQTNWKYFLEFTGKPGDEILESKKVDENYKWEKKTLEFKDWMIKEKKQAENTAATAATTVRAFFSFHRVPLDFRRGEKRRLTEARAKYEDYRFSREDLAKMASVADLTEKYVLVVGKSFGLRAGDFLAITRGDLEAYLDRGVPISIGEYATQKESVVAYPFIDRDALPVIKLMLENMDRKGKTKPSDRMLDYKDAIQLSRIVRRLVVRANTKIGNKRVRFHCLRKFLIDRLSSFMSESKWKQIVGKTIDEGAYVSPDSLRTDYTRAMDEICFTEALDKEKIELLAKKEALKILAKNVGYTKSDMKMIFRTAKTKTIEQEINILEKLVEEKQRTQPNSRNCANGHNCQQIVSEEELPSLLA